MIQKIKDEIVNKRPVIEALVEYLVEEKKRLSTGLWRSALTVLLEEGNETFVKKHEAETNAILQSIDVVLDIALGLLDNRWPETIPYDVYQTAIAETLKRVPPSDTSESISEALTLLQRLRRRLCTTYLSKAKRIPEGMTKLLIVRIPPTSFDQDKTDLVHAPSLSPSKQLLMSYKEDGDWARYTERFSREMKNREDMVKALSNTKTMIENGADICLICFEKDPNECHRMLIAKYFAEQGVEWTEL